MYQQEIENWRTQRLGRLTATDGWLTLVGLYWLEAGENRFGRGTGNDIVMEYPGLPEQVGMFTLHGKRIVFHAAADSGVISGGVPVTELELRSGAQEETTILQLGTISFQLIQLADRFGIRIRDSAAPARTHFKGLQYFAIEPRWRLEARFEIYSPLRQLAIVNVLGIEEQMDSPGALVFDVDGQTHRLDVVLETGVTDYFVIFADRTNGKQTYGAGRFLYVHPPVDGKTVLDFNKAYNPPCVFSQFTACPLPPNQNRLPIEVTAGELKYAGSDSWREPGMPLLR
ncbi:MAG TPA: DUF1684 domain-containing protein [Gammaproteobacteria bacterium]|nr:DUF1684 domain-containing protein [Gammaproteobacteria bacterium]